MRGAAILLLVIGSACLATAIVGSALTWRDPTNPCPPVSIMEAADMQLDFFRPPTDDELEWLDECGFTGKGPG